jgi:hypothetical protein
MYATVQTLMNEWRTLSSNIRKRAEYEDRLVRWLVTEKAQLNQSSLGDEPAGSNRLLLKVMTTRLNQKYADALNPRQRRLIRAYALAESRDDSDVLKKNLNDIKTTTLLTIDRMLESKDCEYKQRLSDVREILLSESTDTFNDDVITRYMSYCKLIDDLEGNHD